MAAQRQNAANICIHSLQQAEANGNFTKLIITGSEMWACGYDVETKQQSSQ
jgi:hypothetical protein